MNEKLRPVVERLIELCEEDGDFAMAADYRNRMEDGSMDGPWVCTLAGCGKEFPAPAAFQWHLDVAHWEFMGWPSDPLGR